MQLQDHAAAIRQRLIQESTGPYSAPLIEQAQQQRATELLDSKRKAAIESLGDKWVFSPNYDSIKNSHHKPAHKGTRSLSNVKFIAASYGRI